MAEPPPIRGICETALYTDDLAENRAFFADVMKLPLATENEMMLAFEAGTSQLLLVFRRGTCEEDHVTSGGLIPGHRADGNAHMAFHVSVRDFDTWRGHFARRGPDLERGDVPGRGPKPLFQRPGRQRA